MIILSNWKMSGWEFWRYYVWYNVFVTRAPNSTHVCFLTEKRIDPTLASITGAL